MSIIGVIIIGILAGFIAGFIVKGTGFGRFINLILGVAGSLLGNWLFSLTGILIGDGILATLISATVGAILIIFVVNILKR